MASEGLKQAKRPIFPGSGRENRAAKDLAQGILLD